MRRLNIIVMACGAVSCPVPLHCVASLSSMALVAASLASVESVLVALAVAPFVCEARFVGSEMVTVAV